MQELETGVSLEIYLFLVQLQIARQESRPMPGLCDPRLPDIIQILEHEIYRFHRWFTRNEDHCQMIREDCVIT
jgi:hypothetical protein